MHGSKAICPESGLKNVVIMDSPVVLLTAKIAVIRQDSSDMLHTFVT